MIQSESDFPKKKQGRTFVPRAYLGVQGRTYKCTMVLMYFGSLLLQQVYLYHIHINIINWCRISFSIPLTRYRFALPLWPKNSMSQAVTSAMPSVLVFNNLYCAAREKRLQLQGDTSSPMSFLMQMLQKIACSKFPLGWSPKNPQDHAAIYCPKQMSIVRGEYVIGSIRPLIWPWPCGSSVFMDFNFCFYISASEADNAQQTSLLGFLWVLPSHHSPYDINHDMSKLHSDSNHLYIQKMKTTIPSYHPQNFAIRCFAKETRTSRCSDRVPRQ